MGSFYYALMMICIKFYKFFRNDNSCQYRMVSYHIEFYQKEEIQWKNQVVC